MGVAKEMWATLQQALAAAGGGKEYKERVFSFLQQAAFGDDKADVVDMRKGGIKEITYDNIDAMKNDPEFKITPVVSGNYVKFYRSPPEGKKATRKDLLYHFRIKISYRTSKSTGKEVLEIKFYPEVGNLAYNAKKTKK